MEGTNSSERNIKNVEEGSLSLSKSSEQGSPQSDILESPPIQVMERPPESSGYRIPSHVFARNKSNNPNQEWSIASNDSLFSIHTGNMSFTREQFSYLQKSGELGMYTPGDIKKSCELGQYGELGKVSDLCKSGELPPQSPKIVPKSREQQPINICKSEEQVPVTTPNQMYKSGEQIIAAHFKSSSPANGITTACASDEPKPSDASMSYQSDASGQSFAFPVLEDVDREKSVNSGKSKVEQQRKDSLISEPKTPTSAPQETSGSSSLFSCFSCCSCC